MDDPGITVMIVMVVLGACAILGALVGEMKGRTGIGAILSLGFGPLGWMIVLLMPMTVQCQVERERKVKALHKWYEDNEAWARYKAAQKKESEGGQSAESILHRRARTEAVQGSGSIPGNSQG